MLEAHRVLPAESKTETKNWWLPVDNVEVLKESCGLELCPICTQLSRQNTTVAYDPLIEAEIVIAPETVEPFAGEVMVAVV
jgi:hypothetical protein